MFITALVFFLILTILVFIHELGHFAMARWIGVAVEEFGFGLPPRIWGKKIGGTVYSINWLPIGGFVKLAGEDETEPSAVSRQPSDLSHLKADSRKLKTLFWARSKKERAAILLAGVSMNFLLAVGITTFLLTSGVLEPSGKVHVERVLAGSPAESAGIMIGDVITYVNTYPGNKITLEVEQPLTKPGQVIEFTKNHLGEEIAIQATRNGQSMTFIVIPRKDYPKGEGPVGVAISDLETHVYPWTQAPIASLKITLSRAWEMLKGIGVLVWRLVHLQAVQRDIAGPIGIAAVTGEAVKFGWKAVLEFMSILSLNLAVLNVLPIPALDGGRLAFLFLEKILGRKVRPAFEQQTHQVGMVVLLILILLISMNDILRLANGS